MEHPVKRIVETENHIYYIQFTPGFLARGNEHPNDVQILAIDGEYIEEEMEVSHILGMGPEESAAIINRIVQYDQEESVSD
ncbi:hypothetical protein I5M27_07960 [Adhaeribacter sp. BT258]|uniref:Uncharacterized protein n=1 Tax=Adhaeribacter terrigena TaxID=2793070 RepID=A0ABS1C2Q1_9BACT|nr:hypothetical protein [Adhaeribacter terrigena]MBK0402918.1 hypothetical protein [Adhaeribacter terrigena]